MTTPDPRTVAALARLVKAPIVDFLYSYANGLDCADAPEAMHFEDAYQAADKGDLRAALRIAFDTYAWVGPQNEDVREELIRRLADQLDGPFAEAWERSVEAAGTADYREEPDDPWGYRSAALRALEEPGGP